MYTVQYCILSQSEDIANVCYITLKRGVVLYIVQYTNRQVVHRLINRPLHSLLQKYSMCRERSSNKIQTQLYTKYRPSCKQNIDLAVYKIQTQLCTKYRPSCKQYIDLAVNKIQTQLYTKYRPSCIQNTDLAVQKIQTQL